MNNTHWYTQKQYYNRSFQLKTTCARFACIHLIRFTQYYWNVRTRNAHHEPDAENPTCHYRIAQPPGREGVKFSTIIIGNAPTGRFQASGVCVCVCVQIIKTLVRTMVCIVSMMLLHTFRRKYNVWNIQRENVNLVYSISSQLVFVRVCVFVQVKSMALYGLRHKIANNPLCGSSSHFGMDSTVSSYSIHMDLCMYSLAAHTREHAKPRNKLRYPSDIGIAFICVSVHIMDRTSTEWVCTRRDAGDVWIRVCSNVCVCVSDCDDDIVCDSEHGIYCGHCGQSGNYTLWTRWPACRLMCLADLCTTIYKGYEVGERMILLAIYRKHN